MPLYNPSIGPAGPAGPAGAAGPAGPAGATGPAGPAGQPTLATVTVPADPTPVPQYTVVDSNDIFLTLVYTGAINFQTKPSPMTDGLRLGQRCVVFTPANNARNYDLSGTNAANSHWWPITDASVTAPTAMQPGDVGEFVWSTNPGGTQAFWRCVTKHTIATP